MCINCCSHQNLTSCSILLENLKKVNFMIQGGTFMKTWQTKKELLDLLCSLVNHQSITGSNAEIALPEYIHHLLAQKHYFQSHPEHLNLHPLDDGRHLLTALVRGREPSAKETIVLLSHFDVVGVEDYGSLENLAFHPIDR